MLVVISDDDNDDIVSIYDEDNDSDNLDQEDHENISPNQGKRKRGPAIEYCTIASVPFLKGEAKDYSDFFVQMNSKFSRKWFQDQKSSGQVYKCSDFLSCNHRFRIQNHNGTQWILQEGLTHNHDIVDISTFTAKKSSGIHIKFRDEIDRMLKIGLTPMKCLTSCKLLLEDPLWSDYKNVLPTVYQISNRKKVLGHLGTFNLDTVSEVKKFIRNRKVSSMLELVECSMSEIIVIKEFDQQKKDNNNSFNFPGFIFSTKKLIENYECSTKLQDQGLRLMSDGTYKLILGDYCLLICGTIDNIVFAFAASENTEAYTALFESLNEISTWAFQTPVRIRPLVHCQDRCSASRNAFLAVFKTDDQNVVVKPCYVHILRNILKNRSKLHNNQLYEKIMYDVKQLHECHNRQSFSIMASAVCQSWRDVGENSFCDWFESELLSEEWANWYVGCCPEDIHLYGVPDTTNAIESFNRFLKRFIPNAVSLSNFFQEKLPMIFNHIGQEIKPPTFNHDMSLISFLKDIPIHQDILAKALKLISTAKNNPLRFSNISKHKKGNQMSYYINSSATLIHTDIRDNNPLLVDASRIKQYRFIHYGSIPDNIHDFTLEQLQHINTLHQVLEVFITDDSVPLDDHPTNNLSQASVVTRNQGITASQQINKEVEYTCTCKGFNRHGFACSHVLAVLHVENKIDVTSMVHSMSKRASVGGRPKKRTPPLAV